MPKLNYVALAIGVGLATAGAVSAWSTFGFVTSSKTAYGEVIRLSPGPHHPEVTFTTQNGEQIRFSANGFISQAVGDHVRVRYLADSPGSSAKIDTIGSIWPLPIVLGGMAALWIVAGLRNIQFKGWSSDDRSAT